MRLRDWLRRTLRLVPPDFYVDVAARLDRIEGRLNNLNVPGGKPVMRLDCGHVHHSYSTYRDGTTQCTNCYEAAMKLHGGRAQ